MQPVHTSPEHHIHTHTLCHTITDTNGTTHTITQLGHQCTANNTVVLLCWIADAFRLITVLLRWELAINPVIYFYHFNMKLMMLRRSDAISTWSVFNEKNIKKSNIICDESFNSYYLSVKSFISLSYWFSYFQIIVLTLTHNDVSRMDNILWVMDLPSRPYQCILPGEYISLFTIFAMVLYCEWQQTSSNSDWRVFVCQAVISMAQNSKIGKSSILFSFFGKPSGVMRFSTMLIFWLSPNMENAKNWILILTQTQNVSLKDKCTWPLRLCLYKEYTDTKQLCKPSSPVSH